MSWAIVTCDYRNGLTLAVRGGNMAQQMTFSSV